MPTGSGNPNPPDKPGQWEWHEVTGPNEAREKVEDLLDDGYHVAIVAYRCEEES